MPRWRLIIEYDGGPFVGWQRQDNGAAVQGAIEDAIQAFSGETASLFGAGRTDSGVHALGQVAHFDLAKDTNADTVRDALNFHLKPAAISILKAEAVADDFHARFDATKRHYLYRILNRRAPAALEAGRVWHVARTLDTDAMRASADVLIGKHDFTSFRSAHCQADSPVKTLDRLDVSRAGEEIHFNVSARSFLHHQVRNFVGTLVKVGEGKWMAKDVQTALDARDRAAAGPTAPAQGLYLVRVDYP